MRALEDLNAVGRTCTRQLYEPMFIVSKGDCSKLEGAKFPDRAYATQRAEEESGDKTACVMSEFEYWIFFRAYPEIKPTKIFVKLCDSL